jgi:hypothetical protein
MLTKCQNLKTFNDENMTKKKFYKTSFIIAFLITAIIVYVRKVYIYNIDYFLNFSTLSFFPKTKVILHCVFNSIFIFFTAQSNFLVIIILIISFTKLQYHKLYSLFGFIVLIDIWLTGWIWWLIAAPYSEFQLLKTNPWNISCFEHTYFPILYTLFYFFNKDMVFLNFKQSLFALIHPLFYLFYSLILGYFTNQQLYRYPYNFMNPEEKCVLNTYIFEFFFKKPCCSKQGFIGIFINNLLLLLILLGTIPMLLKIKKICFNNIKSILN